MTRKRLLIGLIIPMVIATVGASYWAFGRERGAHAQILLTWVSDPNAPKAEGCVFADFPTTHATILRCEYLAGRVINSETAQVRLAQGPIQTFPECTDRDHLAFALMNRIVVKRIENKDDPAGQCVFDVKLKGSNADECQFLLTQLIKSYREYIDEIYSNVTPPCGLPISMVHEKVQARITSLEEQYRTAKQQHNEHTVRIFEQIREGMALSEKIAQKMQEMTLVRTTGGITVTVLQEPIFR